MYWWLSVIQVGLLCLAVLTGCARQPEDIVQPIGEEIPPDPPLLALDAYRGGDQYFLRYKRAEEIFYAAGDLKTPGISGLVDYHTPVLTQLKRTRVTSWEQLTENMSSIPILGMQDWALLRDAMFKDFLPVRPNAGVVVSFDRGDYFFFYDSSGEFRVRRLIDKPPWYSVSATIKLKDFFNKWLPALERFLAERNIESHQVLFNTGDLEAGAIPFLYIDTQSKLIVLVRYDEVAESIPGLLPGSHYLQSLWHFVESHTYTFALRPFSSIHSLAALLSDTALESGRNLFEQWPDSSQLPPLSQQAGMDLEAWELELDQRLGRPASRGELKFLVDGDAFFPRFVDAITSAKKSVDVRAYIFDNDDVALEIAELLRRRSREGIETRVLFDGLGTIFAGGEHSSSQPSGHQAPLSIDSYLKQDSRVKVRSVKNTWLAGDHVKTMVIDERLAFLGGMNIGREYRYDWHDLMMEITGPVVDEINEEFNNAWGKAGPFGDFGMLLLSGESDTNRDSKGYPVRLLHTRPGLQEIFELQREAIQRARRYIYIENAYFTDDVLLKELIAARCRGVDVRVIIPLETDRGVITRNIAMAANIMLANGIRVYIYPGFTHAKAAIFDGWVSVGTANLDRLSLKINREINIATSEPTASNGLLQALFEPDFRDSKELTEPFPERWSDHLIEMFGDYIF